MSLIRSLFMYAALIWFPNTSPSLIQKLQTIQNSALHITTDCVKMISIDHLREETKMLPVQDHLSRINSQYLAIALQPNNPSSSVITSPSGKQNHETDPSIPIFTLCFSASIERYSTPHRLWDHHQVSLYQSCYHFQVYFIS